MNPRAIAVDVLDDYKLRITFANNEIRVFDVMPYLDFPAFKRLQNKGYFSLAKINHGTVCWSEDIDFCPDTIYLESV
jgi:hypothetical protein